MNPRLRCIGIAVLISVGIGCSSDTSRPEAPTAERRFLPVSWRKTVVLEGALDSDLFSPGLMVARDSTIYVYDYGDQAVKAFALDGTLRWRFGRDGRGPGEFANPLDMQLDREGKLWIADPSTSRVTVVSSAGRLVRTAQTELPIERVLPLDPEGFLGFAFAGEKPRFDRFDSLGKTLGQVRHPAWLDTVPSLVSEMRVAVTRSRSRTHRTRG